jgi:5-(carboxyamino)imidazole ribonucleotide mutase
MSKPFIAILMGSDSDIPVMQTTFDTLKNLDIPFEANILSAHRTPDLTVDYVKKAEERGCVVFIAAAGLAAHLAGTVAANTIKPVIGIPMDGGSLNGWDALLSTVQMPGGTPVACVSIGKAGAKNAALLAAEILALSDDTIAKKLLAERLAHRNKLLEADKKLKASLQ